MTSKSLEALNRKVRIKQRLEFGIEPKEIARLEGVCVQYISIIKLERKRRNEHSTKDGNVITD